MIVSASLVLGPLERYFAGAAVVSQGTAWPAFVIVDALVFGQDLSLAETVEGYAIEWFIHCPAGDHAVICRNPRIEPFN